MAKDKTETAKINRRANETHSMDDGDYDRVQGLAFGSTVFENLLLAIIDAHTAENTNESRRTRLNTAMKALIGSKSSGSPFVGDRYDKALLFMAKEQYKDECNVTLHQWKTRNDKNISKPPKMRKDFELAKLAVCKILGDTDESAKNSNAHKLRDMFSGRYWRKGGKRTNIDFGRTYRFRAVEHDYVQEEIESEGLNRLCDELAEWGVATKI